MIKWSDRDGRYHSIHYEGSVQGVIAEFVEHAASVAEVRLESIRLNLRQSTSLGRALSQLRHLYSISCLCCSFEPGAMQGLSEALLRISEFKMMGHLSQQTQSLQELIVNSRRLQELSLIHPDFLTSGWLIDAITQSNGPLGKLYLDKVPIDDAAAFAAMIQATPTLFDISLYHTGLGEQGAVAMFGALENHDGFRKLSVGGNNIGRDGASALGRLLKSNHGLEIVYFGGGEQVGEEGMERILNGHMVNTRVILDLDVYRMSEKQRLRYFRYGQLNRVMKQQRKKEFEPSQVPQFAWPDLLAVASERPGLMHEFLRGIDVCQLIQRAGKGKKRSRDERPGLMHEFVFELTQRAGKGKKRKFSCRLRCELSVNSKS